MAHLSEQLNKRRRSAVRYASSWLGGLRRSDLFDAVERFCLFIGYPRSGHSLIGSLLDAHPDAVVSDELNVLQYVAAGYRRDQLYWLILQRDAEYTRSGRRADTFDYTVPDQWQGRYDRLRVIGDKKGGASSVWLKRRPELLDQLEQIVGTNVDLIHVTRNPFDNIATMSRRTHETLGSAADRYFAFCATIKAVKLRTGPGRVIDVRHEAMIDDPAATLTSLCAALGLPVSPAVSPGYLSACVGVIYPSPHLSRQEAHWGTELVRSVEGRMSGFDFLDGYSFES